MFMQITETVKEAITLIIWDLNSAAMDQNANCGVAVGRGPRAGRDPRLFARKLLSNQEDHGLFERPSKKSNAMKNEEMGLKC